MPQKHSALRTSEGGYTLGACDNNDKTIYIASGLPEHKLKKVLCHEIVHAAIFSYGIDMSIKQEEVMADLIATFGQEIISNTNDIFDYIT